MKKNILSQDFYEDIISQELVAILEKEKSTLMNVQYFISILYLESLTKSLKFQIYY